MAIYLGTTLISSNPTGTGKLYIGTQAFCNAYLGTTQVFDNCSVPNSNVRLTVVNTVGTGSFVTGNPTGTIKSGQPGTAYAAFSSSVGLDQYYTFATGPNISGQVGGTFPASGTAGTTTTITGSLNYNPPASTGTYSLSESGSAGPGVTFSVSPNTNDQTGTIGSSVYSWAITAALANGYTATSAITINGTTVIAPGTAGPTTGAFTLTGDINQASATITATYGGSSAVQTYTYNYTLQNNVSNSTASKSVVNLLGGASYDGANTITGPANSTWDMKGSAAPNSGYEWSGGSRPGSADQTVSGTMPSNNSGSTTITLTGTTQIITTQITVSTYNGACANDACINSSGSSIVYYTGSLPTSVFSNSSLSSPYSDGIYAISGGNALTVYSGTGTQNSCTNSLNTFSNIGNAGSYPAACSNAAGSSDVYFGSSSFQASTTIYDVNTGCSTVGSGFLSNGSQWIQTSGTGTVINVGSC